ncbi:sensor histidine kinase [Actinomadura barringtoniae]|uniref:Sensor histidine kinase n=1 Tax=Actinomadura barringtoniae TaxID=1427535 RepID=A0A939T786_9ACTN|nr:sensor histidine kinase [Actinomadura barringtoniae]MBO2451749.1 sensor histidine kinase [Actinomadura barringtoniae]
MRRRVRPPVDGVRPLVESMKGNGVPRRPNVDLERIDRSGPHSGALCFWTFLLLIPLAQNHGRYPVWVAVPPLVVIAVLYCATVITSFDARVPLRVAIGLFLAMGAAVVAFTVGFRGGYAIFPLLGLASGVVSGHVGARVDGPDFPLLALVGTPTVLSVLVPLLNGEEGSSVFGYASGTATAALVTSIVIRLFGVIGMLREAREELAEAAVEQERLRFSRDLHDLLGHTLSIMVVKSQAVRLIAERDPKVAAEQAADIENIGREALGEVRLAVTGYRGRGLPGELDAARTALADAGIEVSVRRDNLALLPGPDAALGWAVREGVTNVIRHSGAAHCEITLRRADDEIVLEVRDDGTGGPPDVPGGLSIGPGGHGLNGLKERMAAAGGTVTAAPSPAGGFTLRVSVPAEPPE